MTKIALFAVFITLFSMTGPAQPGDHGAATSNDETMARLHHDRSLTPVPPLPEGEGYGSSLREAYVKRTPMPNIANRQTAYLAGGCFWGMEELVRQIPGVLKTEVGYTGGHAPNPVYWTVKTGQTGHAESLKIVFDTHVLSYRHLLFEFFRMHDPTTRNQQGNDIGTQYRSAIFYVDAEQQRTAEEVIRTVDNSGEWKARVVTEVAPFKEFFRAEEYHQKYLVKHPQGYTCHHIRRLNLGE